MADEEDGLAFGGKVSHNLHQLFNFLRGKHCGGFIEDENLILPVEHLENLGALLHPDGDILHMGIGIDTQAVFFGKLDHALAGFPLLQKAHLIRLHAEDDIIQHGEAFHQLEVLVNHSDPQRVRIVRVIDRHHFAVLFDDARFRLIKPEEHGHQGGFSGAVFTKQSVDFSPPQLEGNIVIRFDSGEFLGDVQHLDDIVGQNHHSFGGSFLQPA